MAGGSKIVVNPDGTITIDTGKEPLNLPPEAAPYLPKDQEAGVPAGFGGLEPQQPAVAAFPDAGSEPAAPAADYSQTLPQQLMAPFGAAADVRQPLRLPQNEALDLYRQLGTEPPPSLLASNEGAGAGGATAALGDAFTAGKPGLANWQDIANQRDAVTGEPLPAPPPKDMPQAHTSRFAPKPRFAETSPGAKAIMAYEAAQTHPSDLGKGPSAPGAPAVPGAAAPQGPAGSVEGALLQRYALTPKPASAGYKIPQADIKTNFTIKEGKGPSPETEQAVEGAMGTLGATQATNAARMQNAQADVGLAYLKAADEADAEAARIRSEQATKAAYFNQALGDLDRRMAKVDEQAQENPVDRYWARKGAFGTVMSKIGVALGAMGAAVLGSTTNPVQQQINAEIEQEVDHQKAALDSGHASIRERMGALAEMRSLMLDPASAEAATRALLFQSAASEAQAQAAKASGVEARNAGLALRDQLNLEAMKYRAQVEEKLRDSVSWAGKRQQAQTVGGSAGGKPTLGEAVKRLTTLGFTPDQAITALSSGAFEGKGSPGSERAKLQIEFQSMVSARNRQVEAPANAPEWLKSQLKSGWVAQEKIAPVVKENLDDLANMARVIDNIDALAKQGWSWDYPFSSAYEAKKVLRQDLLALLKKPVIKEANTIGEIPLREALFAADVGNLMRTASQDNAQIQELRNMITRRVQSEQNKIYDNAGATPGTTTGGASDLSTIPSATPVE